MGVTPASAQGSTTSCAPAVARVVSLQGTVEIQRAGSSDWLSVNRLDTSICAGDRLRTAGLSRAALFVQPETLVRVDQHTTITLHQSTDEIFVEFQTEQALQAARDAQSCGAGYFITRFPRKFKVATPHVNAAVEGTEFMVESSCDATKLTVLEGKVLSQTATQEQRTLAANESLVAGEGKPTVFSTVIKPADAVQWVLRYPPLSDASEAGTIPAADECRTRPQAAQADCLTGRAEALLRLGRVDEALSDIDAAIAIDSATSDAHALRTIIQIAKNDKAAALESAAKATAAEPGNHRAWLAQSYAEQASFELDQALASASKALALRPASSLVQARVAELQLSLGYVRDAEVSARAAVAANAAESDAHSILGFVHLSQIDINAAKADLESAIERDSFNAMPRLGLGLAMIRRGELVKGREQLEIAVALDPTSSLLRSYVGKAYYEENSPARDGLAAEQFQLAQQLDPRDPTYSYYDAILQQSQNRPVGALERLKLAIRNNRNRAVYRSQLLVDDDAAAQAASVAAVYDGLGFERLAILESVKALTESAGNHSAHRELATAYANVPRHDIARVSEALQAQIRQPVSVSPVSSLLATDSLLTLKDVGPSQPGAHEFTELFNRDQVQFTVEAVGGSRDSVGGQAVMTGLADRLSYSLSALDYGTDGFTANDAADKSVFDLFLHRQISVVSSIQVDLKRSEFAVGQTFFPFDPQLAEATTISEDSDSARVSGHYVIAPGRDWIWTSVYEDRQREISTFPDGSPLTGNDAQTIALEVQNLTRWGDVQLTSGLAYAKQEDDFAEPIEASITATNLYAYGQWRSRNHELSVVAGFSIDLFELENSIFENRIENERFNPKLGVVWLPQPGTTIRAAAFTTLRRPFVRSQTIEPTQVAGFNQYFTGFEQFFGDPDGTISSRVGVAIDQELSSTISAGLELSKRDLEIPTFEGDFEWDEAAAQAYLYKTFQFDGHRMGSDGWQGAISVEGEYEWIDRPQIATGAEGILNLKTIRMPLAIRFFNDFGIAIRVATTYVAQDGKFSAFIGFPVVRTNDEAWIADLSIEYRLPGRNGGLTLGASNLFDENIDLLEIDALNPRVATRRFLFARFRFNF